MVADLRAGTGVPSALCLPVKLMLRATLLAFAEASFLWGSQTALKRLGIVF